MIFLFLLLRILSLPQTMLDIRLLYPIRYIGLGSLELLLEAENGWNLAGRISV